MKLKRYIEFIKESSIFDQYQTIKNLMYELNDCGEYKIYKENWYIFNDKEQKVGSYYMFMDNNSTLIIDKLDFDKNFEETTKEKINHANLFLEQIIMFCNEHKIVVAVSPDRIRDRKIRKKVKDLYIEHGFISNKGDQFKPIITETMYKPL